MKSERLITMLFFSRLQAVVLANELVVGGLNYVLDPNMKEPAKTFYRSLDDGQSQAEVAGIWHSVGNGV